MNRKHRFSREERINFIKNHIPNFNKINPYLDLYQISMVRDALRDNGYYKGNTDLNLLDMAVSKLLLEAQGKRFYKTQASKQD